MSFVPEPIPNPLPVTGPLTDTQLRLTPVPVSGSVTATISGVATASNQINGSQKTKLVDPVGNDFDSVTGSSGSKYLGVGLIQDVHTDTNNTSTANLVAANSYTFTGTATSTLGVAGIQVALYSTQNATVYVEQSPTGGVGTWYISDRYNYYTSVGQFGVTVQAVSSYVRVRVVLTTTVDTTTFNLLTCLCPVVEVVPRTLDPDGLFQTTVGKITGRMGRVRVSPMGALKTSESCRMVGVAFFGSTVDGNFWTAGTPAGAGGATQSNGAITLSTGTPTANGSMSVQSVRAARYIPSNPNYWRGVVTVPAWTTGSAGYKCVAEFGAFDANVAPGGGAGDGYFFRASQTNPATTPTLTVVSRKLGVDTEVSSFNGDWGASFAIGTSVLTYEIWWTNSKVYFFISDILLHTITSSSTTATSTTSLYAGMKIANSGGATAANTLELRASSISRLGKLQTQPTTFYKAGTVAAQVLKYGPGNVHGLAVSGVLNNSVVTLYDNTAASGRVIFSTGSMGSNTVPFHIPLYAASFYLGLTLAITAANSNATVIYE